MMHPKSIRFSIHACLALATSASLLAPSSVTLCAQPVVGRVFPAAEFAARRARLLKSVGDGVAVFQGTTERPGEQPLRQGNEFYYLTGVVEPRAILVVDGRSRKSSLYLGPTTERREKSMFGPSLVPGDSAARATGLDSVLPRAEFGAALAAIGRDGRTIFTPFAPEVLGSASAYDPIALARATKEDPWDGRESKEDAFRAKLASVAPASAVKDADPIVDSLRAIKSPREIEVLREATRIAGLGIMEAIRDARPGMHEYELQADAEYVFKKHGAYGPAYFALIATGDNTYYTHYHRNTAILSDGDLVQFDYAPDYNYYASDVTRIFPANGKFSPRQREMYGIYLSLYQALMHSIRPYVTPAAIAADAAVKMDSIIAHYPFTEDRIRAAANSFADIYRKSPVRALGHTVGMAVHDVPYAGGTLQPGEVFTIEPEMRIPGEHIGFRLEDMLLITRTGYQNMSGFVPIEIPAIERMMQRHGLSDAALADSLAGR